MSQASSLHPSTSFASAPIASSSPSEATDETLRALLIRVCAGEAAAFDLLMRTYQRRVLSLAGRLLGKDDEAHDAVQEVFLRVHRYLGSFRRDEDFGGWLYRIVVNVCHDIRRRRSSALSMDPATLLRIERSAPTESGQARVEAAEEGRWLATALGQLPEKERTALVLRDVEGLATEEVARILGSTPTTVRSQISLARSKLRLFRDQWERGGTSSSDRGAL